MTKKNNSIWMNYGGLLYKMEENPKPREPKPGYRLVNGVNVLYDFY